MDVSNFLQWLQFFAMAAIFLEGEKVCHSRVIINAIFFYFFHAHKPTKLTNISFSLSYHFDIDCGVDLPHIIMYYQRYNADESHSATFTINMGKRAITILILDQHGQSTSFLFRGMMPRMKIDEFLTKVSLLQNFAELRTIHKRLKSIFFM